MSENLTKIVASLSPILQPETFVFCSMLATEDAAKVIARAKAMIHEDEGISLILERSHAVELGLIFDSTWSQITLMVYSALEDVGVTATVASALAQVGISANIFAGAQHDHVFVPARSAEAAMNALKRLQAEAEAHIT